MGMRDDLAILNRQLHTFQIEEIKELRRISDTIFEPLMRPFRQKRTVQEFSFKKSIRLAQKIGAFMPAYDKVAREHRKSRLVIAMSLAGIDRCSAVSLIPLFSSLKETALDFNFYIYTDDLIKAEFTHDGFLANDYKIAWNHVAGPVVMQRLVDLETENQEDILLIIDSLGGGDSRWYEYWGIEERNAVREEQAVYMKTAGKYGCYNKIRKHLDGDFSKIKNMTLPQEYLSKVKRNTKERWMDTPALEEYMVRWCFNPAFGSVTHGEFYVPYQSAFDIMRKLRGKFRQIHLLTPNNQGSHKNTLYKLLKRNVVDYHHSANTIYGFATVLANIVHGQCPFDGPFTKKVSYEIVKFGEFTGEEDESENLKEDNQGHLSMTKISKCFSQLPQVSPRIPVVTNISLDKRKRGTYELSNYMLPFNELDVGEMLPVDMSFNDFWKEKVLPYDFEIERGDSEYTRFRKAEDVLDVIRGYHIVSKPGFGFMGLVREKRPVVCESKELNDILINIEYVKHNTSSLRDNVESFFLTLAPIYHKYLKDLCLQHVIWCNDSQYSQSHRAISINYNKSHADRIYDVWHELGHHLEAVCPPVGVFSNELLRQKGGKFDRKKLVQVGQGGEWAMPVVNGTCDWIKPYAGKWYKRHHSDLPNDTEIISVYSEYFSTKERLVQLIKYDPNMVRFMAFVFMGGPVSAMECIKNLKRTDALNEISQRNRKSSGYKFKKSPGGYKGGYTNKSKPNHGFGF